MPQPHPTHAAQRTFLHVLRARAPRSPSGGGKMLPFVLMHLAALAAPLVTDLTWTTAWLVVGMYVVRMFGITAGYHRYFAHRSFKTSRVFQFVLAFLAQSSAQKGALWWAAHHRNHHKHSDTPQDLHSPVQHGLWWSHVGWVLDDRFDAVPEGRINDFMKVPELRWLNRFHLLPPALLAVTLFAVGGLPWLMWGFFVSTVLLFHGTFTINSLSHVLGTRRFATEDTSRNNGVLALLTLGEGWHNNHHHYCSSANQGFYWWELDITYLVLRALGGLGVVWDLRTPPQRVLDQGRANDARRPDDLAVPAPLDLTVPQTHL
jgi:stearoyl-CoA desaturase (delta-9 desaturase)